MLFAMRALASAHLRYIFKNPLKLAFQIHTNKSTSLAVSSYQLSNQMVIIDDLIFFLNKAKELKLYIYWNEIKISTYYIQITFVSFINLFK